MSTIKTAPEFTESEALRIAAEDFGISGRVKSLPSERDQNFLIQSPDGESYVLKIANSQEQRENQEFQNSVLKQLLKNSKRPLYPEVLPGRSGERIMTREGQGGQKHCVRLFTYLEGIPLAETVPHSPELLYDLGSFIGDLINAFMSVSQEAVQPDLAWNMMNGPQTARRYKDCIQNPGRRRLVDHFLSLFEREAGPFLGSLPCGVIHNDGNDYNIIVSRPDRSTASFGHRSIAGIIDFGDMSYSYTLSELAVVLAYAMMGKEDPLAAAQAVVAGYFSRTVLNDSELRVLFAMVCMRLIMSVCISAYQKTLKPENAYLVISEKPAWALLEKLKKIHSRMAYYTFRAACGMEPYPEAEALQKWLAEKGPSSYPVCGFDFKKGKSTIFDLSVNSSLVYGWEGRISGAALSGILRRKRGKDPKHAGIGQYGEVRIVSVEQVLYSGLNELAEPRAVHLGVDLFLEAGSPVYAPFEGTVHSLPKRTVPPDCGPALVLRHEAEKGKIGFYTIYKHLRPVKGITSGKKVAKGAELGCVNQSKEKEGEAAARLHFQVAADMLDFKGCFPGMAMDSKKELWLSLCPDPGLILGIQSLKQRRENQEKGDILALRRKHIGGALSLSYQSPLLIVRGAGTYLFDETGRRYLDAVNNVPIVGHSHPKVVEEASRQMVVLNTNTRYLHPNLVQYADRLCSTMPERLDVCVIVNSGSEANDLALRMARAFTGGMDVIVLDGAYHGNLSSLIDISPYKFEGPGGSGQPESTWKVPMPDLYQGSYRYGDLKAGTKYARFVREAASDIRNAGRNLAAFISESLMGCGGQIVLPDGYLKAAYAHVRKAGGVCIADEVQVGFGRVGSSFWGFQTQNVAPDIVTLGKPIGDGFPLAAVITTREVADAFADGMEYFNTFGGNPVSCAVGLAVLDVLEEEGLQQNALEVGTYLKEGLKRLKGRFPLIGDVRGLGLFIGVEFVKDKNTREPAPDHAAYTVERLREEGILISTDGPNHNVLKIKPPLVFSRENADLFLEILERVLKEDPLN